ncbi:MAG: DUF1080 domain-containing protein [Verrucomicrobiae bacterium]|nr:DUF1080 domain-containing protein [Verrucomicrobiae bacterium]
MRVLLWIAILLLSPAVPAAERFIDLSSRGPGPVPSFFRAGIAGTGQPADWQIVLDEVPPTLEPLTPQAQKTAKVPVIAQLSTDPTDERFPLLILDDEVYGDFTISAKVKTVSGTREQMAGIAFRLQDERNFYVVRASSLGNTFRFYKVVDGVRDNPIGPEVEIQRGVWHEIEVQCQGNRIRTKFNGRELIPELTDNSFIHGKIALWTKSDSVSYFRDIKITFTPRESLAAVLVREAMQRYPRLLAVKIFATTPSKPDLHVIASSNKEDIGQPAGKYERQCMEKNIALAGSTDGRAVVTMPLHDRNGDPIAAVRIEMKRFAGQTDANAVGRATPVIKLMQRRVQSVDDLIQ